MMQIASKFFLAWYRGRHPTGQIIAWAYGDDFLDISGTEVHNKCL